MFEQEVQKQLLPKIIHYHYRITGILHVEIYYFIKGLDSSKKDITRINTTTFLKDMFRHAYAIISLIE